MLEHCLSNCGFGNIPSNTRDLFQRFSAQTKKRNDVGAESFPFVKLACSAEQKNLSPASLTEQALKAAVSSNNDPHCKVNSFHSKVKYSIFAHSVLIKIFLP